MNLLARGLESDETVAVDEVQIAWKGADREAPNRRRGVTVRRFLLVADVVGLVSAFALAGALADRDTLAFVTAVPLFVVVAGAHGLYGWDVMRAYHTTVDEFASVFHVATIVVWAPFAALTVAGDQPLSVEAAAAFWLCATPAVASARATSRALFRRRDGFAQRTLIVGAGDVGQLIGRKLLHHPEYGIEVVGLLDSAPKERRGDLKGLEILGGLEDLPRVVRELSVERVVVSFSSEADREILAVLRSLRPLDVQIDIVPRLFEAVGPEVGIHTIEGIPVLGLPPVRFTRSSRLLKRAIDLAGATVALILLAIPMAALALAIKLDSRGSVFYRQRRLGMNMREFTLLKFRTMHAGTRAAPHREYVKSIMSAGAEPGSNGLYKLDRSEDVTKVGKVLRRTSLDELPQLLNVIKGDMSLVGPRPCIPYETEQFQEHHFERFLTPAGMTGLWQVTARAHATFAEALEFDVAYVRGWSLGLDLRLLFQTPAVMLRTKESG